MTGTARTAPPAALPRHLPSPSRRSPYIPAVSSESERTRAVSAAFYAVQPPAHRRTGLRLVVTAFVFCLIAGIEELLIRRQLIRAMNTFMDAAHYNAVFTTHGTIVMFLFAVPLTEGLGMYVAPLVLGRRDMAFPRLGALGH